LRWLSEPGRGLFCRPPLEATQCLVLSPWNSIHTLFMRYAIDIVFIDRLQRIFSLHPNIKPYRFAANLSATSAFEFKAGAIAMRNPIPGDCLTWKKTGSWQATRHKRKANPSLRPVFIRTESELNTQLVKSTHIQHFIRLHHIHFLVRNLLRTLYGDLRTALN